MNGTSTEADLRKRLAAIERLVNTLDREAEDMGRAIERLERESRHFRFVLGDLVAAVWGKILSPCPASEHHMKSLYPEVDPEFGFRHASSFRRYSLPARRWRLYPSVEEMRTMVREAGLRPVQRAREDLAWTLWRGGRDVERKDVIRAA